jgi:hypothetical protein
MDGALAFLRDQLGVDVVKETLRLRLHDFGVETRPAGIQAKDNIPLMEKVAAYIHWIKELRASGLSSKLLCSLDFTFTSHRTSKPTTLAGRGRKNSARSKISRFTNCIITGVLSDGRQLDSILYTYNPSFRTDRKKTKRRRKLEGNLQEVLGRYGISDARIVYDGKPEKETRTFCREYNDMVRDFLEHHKETLEGEDVVFLSDNGNAFKSGNESIIEKLGYGKHIFYPASVHQYLSPNDNKLHGVAKAKWRGMFTNFDDDVACSLALVKCLDDVPHKVIRRWWECNLFLSGGRLRDRDVEEVISTGASKWSSLHNACIYEYKIWAGLDTEDSLSDRRLSSGLDGSFWNQ